MSTALSALLALCAAALFGTSTVLQQAAARREPDLPLLGVEVLRRLVHRPRWLAAVALSGVSFAVQALALAWGPIVLVMPIAATDLLFALPLLAHQRQLRLRTADRLASVSIAGGVGTFLALSPGTAGGAEPTLTDWVVVLAAVGGVLGVVLPLALRRSPVARTALLAAAGAVVFALVDALTKALVGSVGAHGAAALLRWQPYALLGAGVTGIALAQAAYRSGSLLVSLPIIDTVEPVVAVVLGATIFGESVARSPVVLAFQLLAALAAVGGIVVLDRSPLISRT